MPKMCFVIFVLNNIITFVIGDAMIFRDVLERTSQTFFLAAVGLNLDLVAGLCARAPALLPWQDFSDGVTFKKIIFIFFNLSRCCCLPKASTLIIFDFSFLGWRERQNI